MEIIKNWFSNFNKWLKRYCLCSHDWTLYKVWEDSGIESNGDTIMVERIYKICDKCGKQVKI